MINIVCVCHNGMGTSMLAKINITNICQENGIDANVDACAHGEVMSFLPMTDIIITTPEIVEFIPETDVKILTTKNVLDKEETSKLLVECVKENFPDDIR